MVIICQMGRWNQNGAWREFGRWAAAAGMGVYVVVSLYSFFFLAEPFAIAVIDSSDWHPVMTTVKWIFRISILLNLFAVIWMVLRLIDKQEGEWPD